MSQQTDQQPPTPGDRKPPVSGLVVAISIASGIAAVGIVGASRTEDPHAVWWAGGITLMSSILAVVLWLRSRNEQH